MADYAALLRGITPMNATMAGLKKAFERAGFKEVRTILGSGNVRFSAPTATPSSIEQRAEAAMMKELGRVFYTIVRPIDSLLDLLGSDPYRRFRLAAGSKRIVSFLRAHPAGTPKLPIERDGARILAVRGTEILSAYTPSPKGPVFMSLLERTFGKDITTRTWETVEKITRR